MLELKEVVEGRVFMESESVTFSQVLANVSRKIPRTEVILIVLVAVSCVITAVDSYIYSR